MADATTKKLVRLLRPENPTELRSAAALVLGEVGVRDAELTQVLLAALDDADPSVRLQALTAVGKLRIESALARLLENIEAFDVDKVRYQDIQRGALMAAPAAE